MNILVVLNRQQSKHRGPVTWASSPVLELIKFLSTSLFHSHMATNHHPKHILELTTNLDKLQQNANKGHHA